MIDSEIAEFEQTCNECQDGDCSDCNIMEEINKLRSEHVCRAADEDLEYDCEYCNSASRNEGLFCKCCIITKEIDWRRKIRTGRDVYHDGSIIKGGGVSKPEWMDEDQYSEYRMSAEYAHEITYQGFDEPDDEYYD